MNASFEFRQLLEDGDVDALWRAWGRIAPHLPQPKNREQAAITMHMARTAADSIPEGCRLYSHRWLLERGYPSNLPTDLEPTIAEAVGISVNIRSEFLRPAAVEIRGAMEDAVHDCFASGDRRPEVVQAQMTAAKDNVIRALFGRR